MPMISLRGRFIDVPNLRVIFAGGGTGGHLFPAIAIADEVKKLQPDSEFLFVGTKGKIEARVVPEKGYSFRTIWISGFHRSLRLSNILFPLKVIVSFMQSISIIKDFKPDAVVGTGGYVSGPVLRAATALKIPTLIQEQNSYPGATTRLLAKKVNEIHLTFESSKKYFSGLEKVFITGNPTRGNLENVDLSCAYQYFGFDQAEKLKTILVFGGSLGAHTINQAVEKYIDQLIQRNVRIIWQTGREDFLKAKDSTAKFLRNRVWVNTFIDRMDYAYAVSDLVLCRAGATTLAELTRLGKPALLVPYPHAAANHQVENAKTMLEASAAEILYDYEVSEKLLSVLLNLIESTKLEQMSKESKKLGKPNSAREIAQRVIKLARFN